MWFIGVEVEQETSAPPPKKNPASAPGSKTDPMLRAPWILPTVGKEEVKEHEGRGG